MEGGHLSHRSVGVGTEIPLEHRAVLGDDEGHHTGGVALRRPRDECEPDRRNRRLGRQDPEVVAVKRRRRLTRRPDRPALLGRLGRDIPKRTPFLAARGRPVQPILPAGIAAERIAKTSARLPSCPSRRSDTAPRRTCADRDHRELVASDAARQHFLLPAAVSKRHRPPLFTSGTGNGHPSLPITSVFVTRLDRRAASLSATATVNTSRWRLRGRRHPTRRSALHPSGPNISRTSSRLPALTASTARRRHPPVSRTSVAPAACALPTKRRRIDARRQDRLRLSRCRPRRICAARRRFCASCCGCCGRASWRIAPTSRSNSRRRRRAAAPLLRLWLPRVRPCRAPRRCPIRGCAASVPSPRPRRSGAASRRPAAAGFPAVSPGDRCAAPASSRRSVRCSCRVAGAIAALVGEVLAVILPVVAGVVLAVVVVVVPGVVVHVAAAAPSVRAVVVVVVHRRADRDPGGEPDQAGDRGLRAVVVDDHGIGRGRRRVDHGRVVLRHVDDLRVGRLDDDHLIAGRRGLGLDLLLRRGLQRPDLCAWLRRRWMLAKTAARSAANAWPSASSTRCPQPSARPPAGRATARRSSARTRP